MRLDQARLTKGPINHIPNNLQCKETQTQLTMGSFDEL